MIKTNIAIAILENGQLDSTIIIPYLRRTNNTFVDCTFVHNFISLCHWHQGFMIIKYSVKWLLKSYKIFITL